MPYNPGNQYSQYPNNVVPQFRSPKPNSSIPDLKNPPDDTLVSIIVNGNKVEVIKGYHNLAEIELQDFWQPVDEYIYYEMMLKANTNDLDAYETISYANLVDNTDTKISFICLVPQFQSSDLPIGQQTIGFRFTGDSSWNSLGRIYMWSSNDITTGIKTIQLQNNTGKDIYVKVLASTHKFV